MPGDKTVGSSPSRIDSIDLLRGLVMIIMAVGHTRAFFSELSFDPEDLERTWPALFFTRWITYFCAPLFFFLAGIGAFFHGLKRTRAELQRFLWTRGLWLIVLEATVIGFAWTRAMECVRRHLGARCRASLSVRVNLREP